MGRTTDRLLLEEVKGIIVQQATETTIGGGELATQAETDAGTDDQRIVTPLKLANFALASPYVFVADAKANDSGGGGTFTSGAWRTRTINTELIDTDSLSSISSNQITLAAGTWVFQIRCPAHGVSAHRARLWNISDGAEVIRSGIYVAALSTPVGGSVAVIVGRMVLAASKTFEVQHECEVTAATSGFGADAQDLADVGTEYYTIAEFFRTKS